MSGGNRNNAALRINGGCGFRSGGNRPVHHQGVGEKRAEQYTDKLHRCFERIARKETVCRAFSEKYPNAFVTRCEHHYIFYLHPEGKRPRIFAVLHERMDLLIRLKNRLG